MLCDTDLMSQQKLQNFYCPNSTTGCMHLPLVSVSKLFLPVISRTEINLHHWLMKNGNVPSWKVTPTLEHRVLYKTHTHSDKKFSNLYYKSSLLELLSLNYCTWPTEWNLEHKTQQTTLEWWTFKQQMHCSCLQSAVHPLSKI
jgi:hypothetical protein